MAKGKKVTFASMISCGADIPTTYGIYRGIVVGSGDRKYINRNAKTTRQVAVVERKAGEGPEEYWKLGEWLVAMAAPYGTPEYPAVDPWT